MSVTYDSRSDVTHLSPVIPSEHMRTPYKQQWTSFLILIEHDKLRTTEGPVIIPIVPEYGIGSVKHIAANHAYLIYYHDVDTA